MKKTRILFWGFLLLGACNTIKPSQSTENIGFATTTETQIASTNKSKARL